MLKDSAFFVWVFFLFSRRPIHMHLCGLADTCLFSLEKAAQLWPLKSHNKLMPYRYHLSTALQDKVSQNPSYGRLNMWWNETMLEIVDVTYFYCASPGFKSQGSFLSCVLGW